MDRITIKPDKRSGKPCIRGLRMTVADVLDCLASGRSEEDYHGTSRTLRATTPALVSRSQLIASDDWLWSAGGEASRLDEDRKLASRVR